jgi:hypothetical protein
MDTPHYVITTTLGHHDVAEFIVDKFPREWLAVDPRVKVALLANAGTASAAEVFTAALVENGRAALVGTRWVLLSDVCVVLKDCSAYIVALASPPGLCLLEPMASRSFSMFSNCRMEGSFT